MADWHAPDVPVIGGGNAAMTAAVAARAPGPSVTVLEAAPAPYPLVSAPKLFGLPGGVLLLAGALWMAGLRLRADRHPADAAAWWAGMAFVLLLALVAASGLELCAQRGVGGLVPALTVLHLGAVLGLCLALPFTNFAHAPLPPAALLRDAQERAQATSERGAGGHG